MKENKKDLGSDLAKVDSHTIQSEEYEELPEWTDEMFDKADVYIRGERVRRGRPRSENPKQQITLRLDPDIIAAFKATGKGWQTRMNDVLRTSLIE